MSAVERQASTPGTAGVIWLHSRVFRDAPSSLPCRRCDAGRLCQISALGSGGLVAALGTQIRMRSVRAGEVIYCAGDAFRNLYVPTCGICKSVRVDRDGRQQITGFKISGECFGTDGIASGRHQCEAVALMDMQVCVLPFLRAEALADELPDVHRGLARLLSNETLHKEALLMLIANRNAEQRVAAFLLDLSARFGERTADPSRFPLHISREDIGAYLGLTLETVSRTFSHFRQRGLIDREGRIIRLTDMDALVEI